MADGEDSAPGRLATEEPWVILRVTGVRIDYAIHPTPTPKGYPMAAWLAQGEEHLKRGMGYCDSETGRFRIEWEGSKAGAKPNLGSILPLWMASLALAQVYGMRPTDVRECIAEKLGYSDREAVKDKLKRSRKNFVREITKTRMLFIRGEGEPLENDAALFLDRWDGSIKDDLVSVAVTGRLWRHPDKCAAAGQWLMRYRLDDQRPLVEITPLSPPSNRVKYCNAGRFSWVTATDDATGHPVSFFTLSSKMTGRILRPE